MRIILILLCVFGAHCLFEDQIGTYDWRQQYVGRPLFSKIDLSKNRIFLATDKNLLCSLDRKNGDIVWRKLFETNQNGKIDYVHWSKHEIIVIKSNGQSIQSYDYKNGYLKWEWSLFRINNDASLIKYHIIEAKIESDTYYVSNGHELCLLGSKDKSCVDLKHTLIDFDLFTHNNKVVVAGQSGSLLVRIEYDSLINTSPAENSIQLDLDKCSFSEHEVLCQKNDVLRHIDMSLVNSIKFNDYKATSELKQIENFDILASHDGSYLIRDDKSNIYLLKLVKTTQLVQVVSTFETSSHAIISHEHDKLLIVSKLKDKQLEIRAYSLINDGKEEERFLTQIELKESTNLIYLNAAVQHNTLNLLCIYEDYSLVFYTQSGKEIFKREESLADIISVEMIDLPLRQKQEDLEEEFGHTEGDNILMLFIKRIKSQVHQLVEYLNDLFNKNLAQSNSNQSVLMKRDEFGLNKLIIAVTSIGKVFCLHSSNGQIMWSFYNANIKPFQSLNEKLVLPLYVQRTTSHYPHEAQLALVAKTKDAKTHIIAFNPLNGQLIDSQIYDLNIQQVFLLSSTMTSQFLKPLILFDKQNNVHLYPKAAEKHVKSHLKTPFILFTTQTHSLVGHSVLRENLKTKEIWNVNFNDERIISIGSKVLNDRVHSHGKVLGNREVLYKYLNPNMIAIVTEGVDAQKVSFINIYIVDTINGNVIHSLNHKKSRGPVQIVHSENWFFYSYYNLRLKRNEASSVELFEGSSKYNSTYFSSFDPIKPMVVSKSFILQKAFDTMQTSTTEKGITAKDIIAATPQGILYEIPWALIDARRPFEMTEIEREEGLIPYMPEIPLNYEFSLNYYNYVHNVKGIATAPSGLESTSLVFVFGLDTFFTRVFPSKTFDMLREDFDYLFISVFILALLLGTFVTKRLASSTNLKKAWK